MSEAVESSPLPSHQFTLRNAFVVTTLLCGTFACLRMLPPPEKFLYGCIGMSCVLGAMMTWSTLKLSARIRTPSPFRVACCGAIGGQLVSCVLMIGWYAADLGINQAMEIPLIVAFALPFAFVGALMFSITGVFATHVITTLIKSEPSWSKGPVCGGVTGFLSGYVFSNGQLGIAVFSAFICGTISTIAVQCQTGAVNRQKDTA